MRTVEEHLAAILDAIEPLAPRPLPLLEAAGAALAEPLVAPVDLPPFDNSAMDGYAVRTADVSAASRDAPVTLPVLGDIAAGHPAADGPGAAARSGPAGAEGSAATDGPTGADGSAGATRPSGAVGPGQCMRIMTGAPMPGWADTVIPVEWTDAGARRVRIFRPADPGRYIRRRGEDVTEGQVVLAAGSRLGAAQLGLCAAVGHGHVVARPRPTVAVLSTGSELVEPGEPIAPGQIWDSNSYTLTAAAREAGFAARRHGMVADEPDAVLGTVEDLCARADAIVTSGGVSMGVHDVVKEVLAGLGTVRFDQVAMRPGKPQGFGVIGDGTPIFTLPGNPVSAYVSFQVFVRPALCALQGLAPEPLPQLAATLTAPVSSPDGLRHFVRVTIAERDGRREATPALAQGSHQLAALAAADGLAVVPEQVTELDAGAPVEVMPLPAGLATRAVRER